MCSTRWLTAALLVAVVTGHPITSASGGEQLPLKIRAKSLDLSPFGPARAGYLEIGIERWSADEERTRLRTALAQSGTEALAALQNLRPRAGYIRSPGSVGWTVRFARQQATADGGRRIVVATERPRYQWERLNPTPLTRYPFTLVEIQLDRHCKGQGRLIPAARVSWNEADGALEVAEYYTEPVRLNEVTVEGLP